MLLRIDATPTPAPTPGTKKASNGQRVCTISRYPFQRVLFHIQYTYNSSHKINLFSLSNSKSNNYKKNGTRIIKRKTKTKTKMMAMMMMMMM